MTYLILTTLAVALLGGFFALTRFEARRGARYFADVRTALDTKVEKFEFIAAHVDWSSFLKEEFERISHRVGHDVAHFSLQSVRATERLLTQLVRHLRTNETARTVTREPVRPFVRTLSEFKGHLEATRPEMPEI